MGFVANEEPGVCALKLSDLRRRTGGFSGLRELFICAACVILRLKEACGNLAEVICEGFLVLWL